jgi:hypothetical protein
MEKTPEITETDWKIKKKSETHQTATRNNKTKSSSILKKE